MGNRAGRDEQFAESEFSPVSAKDERGEQSYPDRAKVALEMTVVYRVKSDLYDGEIRIVRLHLFESQTAEEMILTIVVYRRTSASVNLSPTR